VIVGNGLVAGALKDRPGVILHAAGVANSTCTDEAEFARDEARLRESLALPGLLVYFGTCSAEQTPYAAHKARLEALVIERGNSLVCKLPILGGVTLNRYTLLNVLKRKILAGEPLEVWAKARRSVVDVEDVGLAVDWLLEHGERGVVTVAPPWDYPVSDIVSTMARELKKTPTVLLVDKGQPVKLKPFPAPVRWQGLESIVKRYYA
jgi:nucleoside-diphosphate-sugar epimerase